MYVTRSDEKNNIFLDLSSGVFLPQPEMACQVLCKNRKQNTSQCCDSTAHCSCGTHTGHYACICPRGHYGQGLHGECTRKYIIREEVSINYVDNQWVGRGFTQISTVLHKLRGCVQTTWTEFWAILTPPPPMWTLLGRFTK